MLKESIVSLETAADPVWNAGVAARTRPVFERLRRHVPEIEWRVHAPWIDAINELKRARRSVRQSVFAGQAPQLVPGSLRMATFVPSGVTVASDMAVGSFSPARRASSCQVRNRSSRSANGNTDPAVPASVSSGEGAAEVALFMTKRGRTAEPPPCQPADGVG